MFNILVSCQVVDAFVSEEPFYDDKMGYGTIDPYDPYGDGPVPSPETLPLRMTVLRSALLDAFINGILVGVLILASATGPSFNQMGGGSLDPTHGGLLSMLALAAELCFMGLQVCCKVGSL